MISGERLATCNRRDILNAGLAVPAICWPGTVSADEAGAADRIRGMIADMDRRFARAGGSGRARVEAGRAILGQWFDPGAIGAAALGNSWTVLTAANRKRYTDALTLFLAKGLAERHPELVGSTWKVLGARSLSSGLIGVFTRTRNAGGRDHDAEWVVDMARGKLIVDVTVDGVTLSLRLRRDFARIMNDAGIESLIRNLESRSPTGAGGVLP